jgi:hypothetical protein
LPHRADHRQAAENQRYFTKGKDLKEIGECEHGLPLWW